MLFLMLELDWYDSSLQRTLTQQRHWLVVGFARNDVKNIRLFWFLFDSKGHTTLDKYHFGFYSLPFLFILHLNLKAEL